MLVVTLNMPFQEWTEQKTDEVLKQSGAIPFPKVPDIIIASGDLALLHVVVSHSNLSDLKKAADDVGYYIISDRFKSQRQGPKPFNKSYVDYNPL